MFGEIVEIVVSMLIIATVAFAPLGYFIYCYLRKNGEPFGDFENRTADKHNTAKDNQAHH